MIEVTVNIDMAELRKKIKPIDGRIIQDALEKIGEERRIASAIEMKRLSLIYHTKENFLRPKYSTPFYIRNINKKT